MYFFAGLEAALLLADPEQKVAAVTTLQAQYANLAAADVTSAGEIIDINAPNFPGRPAEPELVSPRLVERRSLHTPQGQAALVHAVCHIEFNAINLALDAAYRFRDMPVEFYQDWLHVAADEARHFGWLQRRLHELGYAYGDFKAHNGLWEMAEKTAHDVLTRMALVPRVLEARGLDVTPAMIERLQKAGDLSTVAILEKVLAEEIPHVAIGTRWFRFCCKQRSENPETLFPELLFEYMKKPPGGPFNLAARFAAGFTQAEMDELDRRLA